MNAVTTCSGSVAYIKRMRPLLGTFVEIRAAGDPSILESAILAAFAAIERVQRLMSFHDPESEVSRINSAQAGETLRVDVQTHVVLSAACSLSELTDGLFDIVTAAPLVRVGFLPAPKADEVCALAHRPDTPHSLSETNRATYRDLELLPDCHVRWRRKGLIDLGGIAKGYAVDQALKELQARGLESGIVNAGGDLCSFGDQQPIHLRSPHDPTTLLSVGVLRDAAIATSADYFTARELAGHPIGPLVDPRSGACVPFGRSVSIVARECMTADALTKVVALSPERAPEWLKLLEAEALIIDRDGIRRCSHLRSCWYQDRGVAA